MVLNKHVTPHDMPTHHEKSPYNINKSTQTLFNPSDLIVKSTCENQHLDGCRNLKKFANLNVSSEVNVEVNVKTQMEFCHEFVFSMQ